MFKQRANLKRAFYYLKRNGWKNTFFAVTERILTRPETYFYLFPSKQILEKQRNTCWENPILFSIVVPLYHTSKKYLKEMIDSVLQQTYPYLELILADASEGKELEKFIYTYWKDKRIKYVFLSSNQGIAENTNQGIALAKGEFIGLLDHDDILTPDALYEMAKRIVTKRKQGISLKLLYSDEDKCSQDRTCYFEPHYKEDFNFELLLSNNYICHFMVIESSLIRKLKLRREYDGAQDYDLVLRAAGELLQQREAVQHIPKVLYHWRCHTGSTAENPQSKEYAYQAGQRALQDFAKERGWKGKAVSLKHLGFYQFLYQPNIFAMRLEIGAVGGRLVRYGKIAGGIYREDGTPLYQGLSIYYSGYMHRAVLQQEADAVDIRKIVVRKECYKLFQQVVGVPYQTEKGGIFFDYHILPKETDFLKLSLKFCKELKAAGYLIIWKPDLTLSKKSHASKLPRWQQ